MKNRHPSVTSAERLLLKTIHDTNEGLLLNVMVQLQALEDQLDSLLSLLFLTKTVDDEDLLMMVLRLSNNYCDDANDECTTA